MFSYAYQTYILTTAELGRLTGQTLQTLHQDFELQDCIKMANGNLGILPQKVKEYLSAKGIEYSYKVIATTKP